MYSDEFSFYICSLLFVLILWHTIRFSCVLMRSDITLSVDLHSLHASFPSCLQYSCSFPVLLTKAHMHSYVLYTKLLYSAFPLTFTHMAVLHWLCCFHSVVCLTSSYFSKITVLFLCLISQSSARTYPRSWLVRWCQQQPFHVNTLMIKLGNPTLIWQVGNQLHVTAYRQCWC